MWEEEEKLWEHRDVDKRGGRKEGKKNDLDKGWEEEKKKRRVEKGERKRRKKGSRKGKGKEVMIGSGKECRPTSLPGSHLPMRRILVISACTAGLPQINE